MSWDEGGGRRRVKKKGVDVRTLGPSLRVQPLKAHWRELTYHHQGRLGLDAGFVSVERPTVKSILGSSGSVDHQRLEFLLHPPTLYLQERCRPPGIQTASPSSCQSPSQYREGACNTVQP